MVNNSTNINKTKESLNSHGQQFNQYQQNNRKFKQPLSTIQRISTKQSEQPLITSRLRQAQQCGVVKIQLIGSQPFLLIRSPKLSCYLPTCIHKWLHMFLKMFEVTA